MTAKPRMRPDGNGHLTFTGDGLTNFVSGLGTDRDKRSHTSFQYSTIDRFNLFELEAAYSTNWLARAVVDYAVDDATREWRSFSCEEASDIQRAEKRFSVQAHVQQAFKSARLYGGAVIIPIIDGQDLTKPLDVSRIKAGSLRRFIVVDRRYIAGMDYEYTDPTSGNFLMPRRYMIASGSVQIHHSHVIRIPGEWIPMAIRQANGGWDDSALRKCLEDIKDAVSAKAGIASLIQEANVDVIKNENLADELATEEGAAITERYRLAGTLKSINRLLLLDGDESYERKAASFGGLGEILGSLMEWVSGAADYPMTRLFGVQSKGMGDSGGGDEKNYHNAIRGKQESDYRPVLERMDEIIMQSELGDIPDDCEFEFNPLVQPSGAEQATAELALSQADGNYLQEGVITASLVARRLQASGTYAISDEYIEGLETDEKAREEGLFEEFNPDDEPPRGGGTNDSWNESDHPRDEDGKFSSGGNAGGTSNQMSGVTQKSDGGTKIANTGTYEGNLAAASDAGYDTSTIFVHRSGSDNLGEIKEGGNFPGLFTLEESDAGQAEMYGEHEYRYALTEEPWGSSEIEDSYNESDDNREWLALELGVDSDDDIVDKIEEIVINEDLDDLYDEEVMSALKAIDEPDAYKEAQILRAKLAAKLGAPAITIEDEFSGETVMVLPGDKAIQVFGPGDKK